MAYTLTQARPLLNATELQLFDQSRTLPVKTLTPAKLASAVKRARTARDKYRDLYQRQTVGVRTRKPGTVTGNDNERTQRKADILQEVLERYEARVTWLDARGDSKAAGTTKSRSVGKATAKASATKDSVKKRSAASGKTAKAADAPSANKAGAKASRTASAGKATTKPAKSADKGKSKKASGLARLNTLVAAGAKMAAEATPKRKKVGAAPARSSKAPSRKAPTANNKASAPDLNAPMDIVPAAKRASPLKQDPTNIAIQGHQSSRGRRTQGKRDSR